MSVLLLIATICGLAAWILKNFINFILNKIKNLSNKIKFYAVPLIAGLLVALISLKIGGHSFGAGVINIHDMLKTSINQIHIIEVIGRFLNTILSYISGCAGGLLLPSMALGGGIGSVMSILAPAIDSRICVSIGMASFLSIILNAPLTAAVLVLETTNQKELILPLFMATLLASFIVEGLNKIKSF